MVGGWSIVLVKAEADGNVMNQCTGAIRFRRLPK